MSSHYFHTLHFRFSIILCFHHLETFLHIFILLTGLLDRKRSPASRADLQPSQRFSSKVLFWGPDRRSRKVLFLTELEAPTEMKVNL